MLNRPGDSRVGFRDRTTYRMNHRFSALVRLLSPGVLLFGSLLATAQVPLQDVSRLYTMHCANCHGANLEGGQADSMLNDHWLHGGDDASLARSIRDGLPESGMAAFGGVLSDAEIRAMVVFIREKAGQARRDGTPLPPPPTDEVVQSQEHPFRLNVVAENLVTPWGMAFLPDGRMLVAELPGRLRFVTTNGRVSEPVAGTPAVWARGQGGLMDVALHPGFATNGWVYLAFSHPLNNQAGGPAMTSVARGRIRESRWEDEQIIFRAPAEHYRRGNLHFGTRLVFDGRGHLFFAIGDRGRQDDAQDLSLPNGKVHRVHDDGSIPADNPFLRVPNAVPSIWSFGHRNPQGMALDSAGGDLWVVEHGPRGGDELNLVRPGLNYGWPLITHGINYDGTPITPHTARDGLEQPVIHWTPSIAVCDLEFYTGDAFPRWRGNLFATALAQQELRRLVVRDRRVVAQEVLFRGIGRVRAVITGPDGCLYIALNQPDRIARLAPAAGRP